MDTSTPAPPPLSQKLLAEAIGTFVLVLFGCGSLVLASTGAGFGDANILSVGLAFGLTVTVMAYAVGWISGGHFNPAVSVGAALSGRMSWKEAGPYAAAQVVGGILGAAVLVVFALGNDAYEFFDAQAGSLAANGWGDDGTGYPLWAALLVEAVLTAIFVLVVLAVTDKRNEAIKVLAPLTVGLTLAVIHFVAIPLTGTSVNPARSIGPALLSGTDAIVQLWVFIIAPLVGGAGAGLLYPALFGRDGEPVPGSGLDFASKPAPAGGGYGPGDYQQQWAAQPGQPGQSAALPAYGGSADQGYGAPVDQGAYQQPGGYAPTPAPAEQPIIQDGWQWDPQAQQWIPAQQQPPAAGGSWTTPGGGEQTQVRGPNDGS